jgi:homoserine kinase
MSRINTPTPSQVFNMQRLAVLTTALGQTPPDPELIFEAMKDRVHQPYRKTLVRSSHSV